jgi:heavy metal translocating P-type ATPase
MKRFDMPFRHCRRYKLFSLAIVAVLIGIALELGGQPTAAHWVVGSVAILELFPLLYAMVQNIRSGTYGIDVLAATAIVTAVLLHQSWAALIVVVMLAGGQALVDYAKYRSKAELEALLKQAPDQAHLIRSRKTVDVAVNDLQVGDKITIKPGEIIPADAIIIEGNSSIDESNLIGQSTPRQRTVGDTLLSGTLCTDGIVTAKVTATAADSHYQHTIKLVRAASESQSPFIQLADRYSIPFTLMAFAVASAAWVVSGYAIRFLEVIIVATPSPLLLAAPIALISGMSRASRHGIIIKNGAAMERLADAETIAFDKTGTLTQGRMHIANIIAFDNYKQSEVLALAASVEQGSSHVVAQAVVAGALDRKIKLIKTKHVTEITGRGVTTHLKGQEIVVGNISFLKERGIVLPKQYQPSSVKQTATYVAVNQQLAGIVLLDDELRTETALTLQRLTKLGLSKFLMITGDNRAAAKTIATKLGIADYHADMLPSGKLRLLEAVAARPLVFVGDGINDSPALTASDVGIALGARGSTAASESADIVIMTDDLAYVATVVSIAKRTFKIARQSIVIGVLLSFILIAAFLTGKFSPLTGALVQEAVDVVVIFYALRAHSSGGEAV